MMPSTMTDAEADTGEVGTPAPNLGEIQSADPQATRSAASSAANNLPVFGSVTQSSNFGGVAGGSPASASFDGTGLEVTISREDGSSLEFDSSTDPYEYAAVESGIDGHTGTSGIILDFEETSISAASVKVSWDNSDPADYLAGGYWVHVQINASLTDVTRVEIGAFMDGPELSVSSPPDLPTMGTASYSGPAEGFYAQAYGSDAEVSAGSTAGGLFYSAIDLTADFDARTISGCVGCSSPIHYVGTFHDAATGRERDVAVSGGEELRLGPTPIDSNGSFRNKAVWLTSSDFNVTSTSGAWGGQFSNIQDAAGDPRLVAGTFGGESVTSGDTEAVFIGAYYATK